ncbi:hypothetical protein D8B26_006266 [Coccidioides posadasii str. Silveira]|uniref:Oligopeptide transporter n=3 Tax=Coccidioides posadasii TaxID=199306 RepID=E9CSL4_COCPS|nr:proton-dependent oligopeptide transport (POT) family protein [Coccidioides posadasii C735 delta SOWgp]EER27641.1 proton-dependent oligopeptide transport (POT) family protein [Coccidioides posadasii C735 delta SOWgp]EFW22674.1 oligopeptide transporter [Coccidioides posadasii str. Silveira]KMM67528.1 peptide transporter [Coccidioides posadasii RMSCC 3488]QVM11620.1 hypothetical protein D8B26_006266 [Coccidioides posadasii str. Silveira]|eukprot:XP_003069786.1 proton-dependent oligopeptide transport (POT) family protein [Coccidioides posadasii C735 delta SOWgp]
MSEKAPASVDPHKGAVDIPHVSSVLDEKEISVHVGGAGSRHDSDDEGMGLNRTAPTDEEMLTLRRVSDKIPWITFSIAFVELCERFSYYGTINVFTNYIQRPLPEGSTTGAGGTHRTAGALGLGQRASAGLTMFNQFWSYIMPLVGAYVADQYLGRFKTIMWSIACAMVGHIILIISALPPVIAKGPSALAAFAVGVVVMGIGTGGFKSNISPLIAEQYKESHPYVTTTKKGERVIVDPAATISRIYHYFYLMINIGALVGQVSMVYAEKYVGFYLSFLLPTIMFSLCPLVLFLCRKVYVLTPPQGSVYGKALKVWGLAMKGRWSINPVKTYRNFQDPNMWEAAKPSNIPNRPAWMNFDDAWVDEVRRGLLACKVFLWYPLFWLSYNQMTNNLTSQAATMTLNGVPNDVVNNLNPFALILFIPIMDRIVYPILRKLGIKFTPLKRITAGFFIASCAMIAATVIQYHIYKLGPCGKYANTCAKDNIPAPITVWVQAVPYVCGGISEIFASVTSLEYAFTKAPKNMRSLVQAVALFMNALSSALGQALVSLAEDPLLIWNYGVTACLTFAGGIGFWLTNYKIDKEEDKLNTLPNAHFKGQNNDEER